jgi:hypothetical protein
MCVAQRERHGFRVFKNEMHPREGKQLECEENYVLGSAELYIMHYSVEQIQKNAIGRTCRTLRRYRLSLRIILKWI